MSVAEPLTLTVEERAELESRVRAPNPSNGSTTPNSQHDPRSTNFCAAALV